MQSGDNVLIHAGASGVGQSAIQLARLGNANKIFTTAGSDEKCELCRSLGADFAINYKSSEDFADVVARETNGQGVDLIVDLVGADYWHRNVASAAYDSRIVIIAMLSGSKFPGFDMRPLQTRRIWICTTTLRTRRVEYQVQVRNVFVEKVLPALKGRKIRSVIDKVYPWNEVSEAHKRLESNANAGKLICTVD
jgi:NADPH:quinone reductase-like Zn-dependent oxidoreductase